MKRFKGSIFLTILACSLVAAQTPEEILDLNIEAIGGSKNIQSIESMILSGVTSMSNGISGKTQIFSEKGGKVLSKMTVDAPGMKMTMTQGCDGKDCYAQDQMMGLRLLEGQDKDQLLLQNDFTLQGDWRKMYSEYDYKGEDSYNGRKVYKIFLKTTSGMEITNYYDAETFLVLKADMKITGMMGVMETEVVFEEYEDVHHGFLIPKTTIIKMMGMTASMKINSAEVNVDIPDDRFALPQGLK